MWEQLKRIIKPNGAIVLFGSQPFTSVLITSNLKMYRHQWVWNKNNSAGFATAKIRPFSICEDILVFGKNKVNYYPIMTKGKLRKKCGYSSSDNYTLTPTHTQTTNDEYYPKNLLDFSNASQVGKVHPTQKPVALLEYLIKTYTNEGETVLDFAAGSMSTAIACINTNRKGIMIEKDEYYFKVGSDRVAKALQEQDNDNI